MTDRSLWILLPVAQRRDGSWIDDTLTLRNQEGGFIDRAPEAGMFPRQRVELFRDDGPFAPTEAVDRIFRLRGWTDGLPIVPPTTGRVAAMVAAVGRSPGEVIGEMAPLGGLATIERIAANAVMAGCGTDQFAFVLAAVEAIVDPAFNLAGLQTTDENVTPLIVISAPTAARRAAQINAGFGVLGPGWRGNATIGRAVRLVLNNLGGGWPGAVSFAGAGQAGRFSLCIAEDDDTCPWPPLRMDAGFEPGDSIVIVGRAESAVNVTGGLNEIVSVMSSATSAFTAAHRGSAAVLLAPYTAGELAARGLSRSDVAQELAARAVIPVDTWQTLWIADKVGVRASGHAAEAVPVIVDPSRLLIVVAGGTVPIPQHVWFPGWGFPPAHIARPAAPGNGRS